MTTGRINQVARHNGRPQSQAAATNRPPTGFGQSKATA